MDGPHTAAAAAAAAETVVAATTAAAAMITCYSAAHDTLCVSCPHVVRGSDSSDQGEKTISFMVNKLLLIF